MFSKKLVSSFVKMSLEYRLVDKEKLRNAEEKAENEE
jgi:hypothetical protein